MPTLRARDPASQLYRWREGGTMRLHITHTLTTTSLLHVTVTHYFAWTLHDCQACLPIPKACSSVRKLPRYAIRKQFSFFLTKNLDNFLHALTQFTTRENCNNPDTYDRGRLRFSPCISARLGNKRVYTGFRSSRSTALASNDHDQRRRGS